jgi:hypothetical protein
MMRARRLVLVLMLVFGSVAGGASMAEATAAYFVPPIVPPIVGGGASGGTLVGGAARWVARKSPYALVAGAIIYVGFKHFNSAEVATMEAECAARGGDWEWDSEDSNCDYTGPVTEGWEIIEEGCTGTNCSLVGTLSMIGGDIVNDSPFNGSAHQSTAAPLKFQQLYAYWSPTTTSYQQCTVTPSSWWSNANAGTLNFTGNCGGPNRKVTRVQIHYGSSVRTYRIGDLQDPSPPAGRIQTFGQCKDVNGVLSPVVAESRYTADPNALPPAPSVVCPEGTRLDGMNVNLQADGAGTQQIPLLDLPDPILTDVDEIARLQSCLDAVLVPCELHLFRKIDGKWVNCLDLGEQCAEWATDPQRLDKYQCQWGPHVMELSQCIAYRDTFKDDGDLRTQPAPEDDTSPELDPDPAPSPESCDGFFASIMCAGSKLFTPQQTGRHLTRLKRDVLARPPGSIIALVVPAVEGFGDGWGSGDCGTMPSFMPNVLEAEGVSRDDGRFPCAPPAGSGADGSRTHAAIYSLMVVAIGAGTVWRLFSMTSAALNSHTTGGEG